MPETSSPAIAFGQNGYEATSNEHVLRGLAVANRSFLYALIRHGGLETLYGYMLQMGADADFEQLTQELGATMPVRTIQPHRLDQLAEQGGLFLADPSLASAARRRSFVGAQAYALTGITHTTAEECAMFMLADLATAPVQPWDALVCSSRAVAAMVNQVLRTEEERLKERLGATSCPRPLLPVIPLGVHTADFTQRPTWRAYWRERLEIGSDDVAVLHVGRLSRSGKAHPLPMFMALGEAARRQPRPLHLILAGYWLHPPEEAVWRENAELFCPEVRLHVLEGRDKAVRREIWSAADLFTSLVDNIQETFGLAVIEAMAAGLPVVVTDWDGFRDTVRHGVDGILVPTLMAPPGEARQAALCYATGRIGYGGFLAETAQLTAVDISAAAEAFRALAADPGIRRRMGAASQARVREVFDWSAIIPQYQALWREQQAIRRVAVALPVPPAPDPRHMDPTRTFAAWPSDTFELSRQLRPAPSSADLSALLSFTASALPTELDEATISQLLAELHRRGETRTDELLEVLEPTQRDAGRRAVLRLLRMGLAM